MRFNGYYIRELMRWYIYKSMIMNDEMDDDLWYIYVQYVVLIYKVTTGRYEGVVLSYAQRPKCRRAAWLTTRPYVGVGVAWSHTWSLFFLARLLSFPLLPAVYDIADFAQMDVFTVRWWVHEMMSDWLTDHEWTMSKCSMIFISPLAGYLFLPPHSRDVTNSRRAPSGLLAIMIIRETSALRSR